MPILKTKNFNKNNFNEMVKRCYISPQAMEKVMITTQRVLV